MSIATQTAPEAPNPLGVEREGKLLVNFAIPCIISMLVTALYNIVDQIFIGQGVGLLGNAATNIAFPLSTACTACLLYTSWPSSSWRRPRNTTSSSAGKTAR